MHLSTVLTLSLALATSSCAAILPRQHSTLNSTLPLKPAPCVRQHPYGPEDTQKRFQDFAQAFIYDKNLTKAFGYIAKDYINHNPMAKNGSDFAWYALSPIWKNATITPIRTTFKSPQGWLNYKIKGAPGDVVDRFRWEGGCIVEHWDAGEKYPGNVTSPGNVTNTYGNATKTYYQVPTVY